MKVMKYILNQVFFCEWKILGCTTQVYHVLIMLFGKFFLYDCGQALTTVPECIILNKCI